MKRVAIAVLLLALLGVAACGGDEPAPAIDVPPAWAKVAPEQIAEAKKHGVPVAFENEFGMRFVLIPAGTFLKGSPEDERGRRDDETQHEVTVLKPFYIQITEVMNERYRRWKPDHDSGVYQERDLDVDHGGSLNGDEQPVTSVSWNDAVSFASWLACRDDARTYYLPSESEWEYACRAGTTTPTWLGEDLSPLTANAEREHGCSVRVASYAPNAWGVHDTIGNVAEWCGDRYDAYPGGRVKELYGGAGRYRVFRGGCWGSHGRSADRMMRLPEIASQVIGFRLVSPLPESSK